MVLPLSQSQFRRRLTRAIALPIVLLLLLSSIFIWQTTRLLSDLHRVDEVDQIISQANTVQKLLLDMETGFRGYLLAGRQEFLEPYEQADARIEPGLNQLRGLVSNHPDQLERVNQLVGTIQQWKQQLPPALDRTQQGEPEPLSALEQRKQSFDQIRQQIASFIVIEEQLRNQRSQTARQTVRTVISGSLLLALVIGGILAYFTRRQILRVSGVYEAALQTAHNKTEEAQQLAIALQQYKDIFQFAEHGLAISRGSRLEQVNPAFARLHGFTVEELIGMPILNLFPPEIHAETIAFIQHLEKARHLLFESTHLRKDGSTFSVLLDITMVADEPNLPYRIVNLFDITERKQAEVALRQSLKDLADVKFALDQSAIVAITDAQGIITYVNDKFCEISQYSREELIGQNHRIINSGYHSRQFFQQLWTTIAQGAVWQGEIRNLARDGTFYWVATTIVPFLNQAGKPYQYIAIRSDITARKMAETELQQLNTTLEQRVAERTAQLEETNQELEAFTYSVSHDLRAPLRTMRGFTNALLEDCSDRLDNICQSYIHSISEDAIQMNGLINDLLTYSRLTRTQISLQPTKLDEVVEESLNQLAAQIQENQAQIHVASPLPQVMAHRLTLVQSVTNLISNAIKFVESDTQPQVDIFATTERHDDHSWVQLWIIDNGIGIASEHQERIFRVFERLHGADRYPGTGIGLAIVRKGLDRMGGRVGLESQVGNGTRFWVALPEAVLIRNNWTDDPTASSSPD